MMKALLVLGVSLLSFKAMAAKFPIIEDVTGKVQVLNKDGQESVAKKRQVLSEKASVLTPSGASVVLKIDAARTLQIYENSQVDFPSISWETGEVPVVILKKGSLRWKEEAGRTYRIALRSDLFELLTPPGDFVFSMDPKTAVAEVRVIQGRLEFSAMNAEDVVLVGEHQKVQFQGVIEGDEIVYDILLKGKRIPRGKLGKVEAFSENELKLYDPNREKSEKNARLRKELAAKKAQQPQRGEKDICEKPFAQLNQCAWFCENNPKKEKKICRVEQADVQCVRKRCNANGEWAEGTPVSKEKAAALCGIQPVVRNCDY